MKLSRISLALIRAKQAASRRLQEVCGGGSTGMDWCPELNLCIQPWAETCNIEGGDTFSGTTQLTCDGGRCSSGDEKCVWTEGSANMATYYFADLEGAFEVPEGCTLNCTGCIAVTDSTDEMDVGIPNPASVNCVQMNGTLETKYDSAGEYALCVFEDGFACEEWALERGECENGSQPIFSKYCADNEGDLSNNTIDWGNDDGALEASYQLCTVGDVTCEESSYYAGRCTGGDGVPSAKPTNLHGSDDDEYVCGGGSTGMDWCPELNVCIQPWAETCNVEGGDTFSGTTQLTCDGGRCSSGDEKCVWTEGSTNMATYYFADLEGAFEVPEGCTLNCTGCIAVTNYADIEVDAFENTTTTMSTEADGAVANSAKLSSLLTLFCMGHLLLVLHMI